MEHTEVRRSGLEKVCKIFPVSWKTSICLGRSRLPTTKQSSRFGSQMALNLLSQRPVLLLCLQRNKPGKEGREKHSSHCPICFNPSLSPAKPPAGSRGTAHVPGVSLAWDGWEGTKKQETKRRVVWQRELRVEAVMIPGCVF